MDGVRASTGLIDRPPASPLAALDDLRPVAPGAEILESNLAALRGADPLLAAAIADAALPPNWFCAINLDDQPAYCEWRASSTIWMGGSAAPRTRAAALLATFRWSGQNVALPAVGAGAELALLLETAPPAAAVFVLEPDLPALAAVLRTCELAGAIRAGRCIFIWQNDPAAALRQLLASSPGLLAPAQVLRLAWMSPECIEHARSACESAFRASARERAEGIEATAERIAAQPVALREIARLALIDFRPADERRALHAPLLAAAATLCWEAVSIGIDGPTDAHACVPYDRLATFRPDLCISIDGARRLLPPRLPGKTCDWVTTLEAIERSAVADDGGAALIAAASPAVMAALQAGGIPAARLTDLFWAVADDDLASGGPFLTADDPVALLSEPIDARPEHWGIDQPAHCLLWERVRSLVGKRWDAAGALNAEHLLSAAQREMGARVEDAAIRRMLLRGVERALIPAGVAERIQCALENDPIPFIRLTRGGDPWTPNRDIPDLRAAHPRARSLPPGQPARCNWASATPLRLRALIVPTCADPLSPAVLQAAAWGRPLLVHDPHGSALQRMFGGVAEPRRHLTPFSDAATLRAALRTMTKADSAEFARARELQAHVRGTQTWRCRLRQLAKRLRG